MANLASWHRRLTEAGPVNLAEQLLLPLLIISAWLYGTVMRLRRLFYASGLFAVYRAPVPVLSVGNLAVGGTGKTPVTDLLVRCLLQRGIKVAVVSRGYGGSGVAGDGLVCAGAGPLVGPEQCGDEPYLLAQRNTQALILVDSRRARGVAAAVNRYGAELVVLDDAFQHLAVARDLDIVLLDARQSLLRTRLLPAGRLREPPAALERADLLVLTHDRGEDYLGLPAGKPLLRCRHQLAGKVYTQDGACLSLTKLIGQRGVAFAGIADPEGFFDDLRQQGITLAVTIPLPDHASYNGALLERLQTASAGADFLVTTEKDYVKLAGISFAVPCYAVPLEIVFNEPAALDVLLDNLTTKGSTMPLDQELLKILACPKCKGAIALREDGAGIECPQCRLLYPIRDDIPVMLIDEAEEILEKG